MRRAALVMLLATLTAVVSGINEASWAGEEPSAQAREEGRQRVVERLAGIPLQAVLVATVNFPFVATENRTL